MVIIILVFGGLKDSRSSVVVRYDNMESAKQYLDGNPFEDISMMHIYKQIFGLSSFSKDQKIKLTEFQLGLNRAHEIRVMTMEVIDTSNSTPKKYLMLYNRDTNYFNVGEISGDQRDSGYSAVEILSKFDKDKNQIMFPQGNYRYYTLRFYSIGSMGVANNVYLIKQEGAIKTRNPNAEGFIYMVYGEPIEKMDSPSFYIMSY
ncbi:hypothetical protein Desaci_0918 [Desulfosporosinus acidiphilus SJ4]|uniref:Uncharacterized protein n=1 Tax=Desulfosporosinus acidiphilus (strain DSM 22704 / JCM 16185 / SJ4) TaxID=646529 RepID=I4D2E0_DESAJ|nr:hypothetical protein [Desulfosporosinus acidiphilus]AFM39964.1 hypothetical protein Desaci_0918 [Desulfosporosinus acidiphilus SJ4]